MRVAQLLREGSGSGSRAAKLPNEAVDAFASNTENARLAETIKPATIAEVKAVIRKERGRILKYASGVWSDERFTLAFRSVGIYAVAPATA